MVCQEAPVRSYRSYVNLVRHQACFLDDFVIRRLTYQKRVGLILLDGGNN